MDRQQGPRFLRGGGTVVRERERPGLWIHAEDARPALPLQRRLAAGTP